MARPSSATSSIDSAERAGPHPAPEALFSSQVPQLFASSIQSASRQRNASISPSNHADAEPSCALLFDEYTERSVPSLDMQKAHESTVEQELAALLQDFFVRIHVVGEQERARTYVDAQPKLDINPYRPPRGAHLKALLTEMHVSEWGGGLSLCGSSMDIQPKQMLALSPTAKERPAREQQTRDLDGLSMGPNTRQHTAVHDHTFEIVGRAIPVPCVPWLHPSALGGWEEETLVADGAECEVLAEASDGGSVASRSVDETRRVELGLGPIAPRACMVEECRHHLFTHLWCECVVPLLVAALAPKERENRKATKDNKVARRLPKNQPLQRAGPPDHVACTAPNSSDKRCSGSKRPCALVEPVVTGALPGRMAHSKVKQYLEEQRDMSCRYAVMELDGEAKLPPLLPPSSVGEGIPEDDKCGLASSAVNTLVRQQRTDNRAKTFLEECVNGDEEREEPSRKHNTVSFGEEVGGTETNDSANPSSLVLPTAPKNALPSIQPRGAICVLQSVATTAPTANATPSVSVVPARIPFARAHTAKPLRLKHLRKSGER